MLNSQARPQLQFVYAVTAILGQRKRQEDYCLVWRADDGGEIDNSGAGQDVLVVLADGMGGHVSGETASRTACDGYISAFIASPATIEDRLDRALDHSNNALRSAIAANEELEGMGSTIVAAWINHDGLRWASVGDSTLLLFRDGVLRRLNADHSHGAILDEQAAQGIISEEAARSDTRRRALHSALTGHPIPLRDIETQAIVLEPGDWIIVASDGIFTLSGDEIATTIDAHGANAPDALAKALVDLVHRHNAPHQDNTTIAVVRIDHQLAISESEDGAPSVAADGHETEDTRPQSLPVFGKTTIPHDTSSITRPVRAAAVGSDGGVTDTSNNARPSRVGLMAGLSLLLAAAAIGLFLLKPGSFSATDGQPNEASSETSVTE